MSVTARVKKRERSMAELIVVIVLFSLLITIFIQHFISQQNHISQAGFERLADNFLSKANVVRSQWLMEKKPKTVLLSIMGSSEKESVTVNRNGWLDINEDSERLACQKIWQLALDIPMEFMKSPVSAVEINLNEQQGRVCRYSIDSGQYFEYYRLTGKVVK